MERHIEFAWRVENSRFHLPLEHGRQHTNTHQASQTTTKTGRDEDHDHDVDGNHHNDNDDCDCDNDWDGDCNGLCVCSLALCLECQEPQQCRREKEFATRHNIKNRSNDGERQSFPCTNAITTAPTAATGIVPPAIRAIATTLATTTTTFITTAAVPTTSNDVETAPTASLAVLLLLLLLPHHLLCHIEKSRKHQQRQDQHRQSPRVPTK